MTPRTAAVRSRARAAAAGPGTIRGGGIASGFLIRPADNVACGGGAPPPRQNDFAFDFYREVGGGGDNVFFSPPSIHTAFSILYEGAGGRTALQMSDALGISPDQTPDGATRGGPHPPWPAASTLPP